MKLRIRRLPTRCAGSGSDTVITARRWTRRRLRCIEVPTLTVTDVQSRLILSDRSWVVVGRLVIHDRWSVLLRLVVHALTVSAAASARAATAFAATGLSIEGESKRHSKGAQKQTHHQTPTGQGERRTHDPSRAD